MASQNQEPTRTTLVKGKWTPDEDDKLIEAVALHGAKNWTSIASKVGLNRSGKSLRKIVICSTWIIIVVDKETLDMLTALGMGDIPGVRLESTELQAASARYSRGGPRRCQRKKGLDVHKSPGILAVTKQIEILNSGLIIPAKMGVFELTIDLVVNSSISCNIVKPNP
ncbi:hypothetical protein ACLB2K_071935 [Fragaria x ananassa]